MVNCVIRSCRNTSAKMSKDKDGITFHRFPRDKERRREWEIAVNREEAWSSSSASAVCSEHFDSKYFYLTESGLRRLTTNAIPAFNLTPCQTPEPKPDNDISVDIIPMDSEEVIQLKNKVKRLEAISANRKRRLNRMLKGKRRLRKKLESMKCLIGHLIKIKNNNVETNKDINK